MVGLIHSEQIIISFCDKIHGLRELNKGHSSEYLAVMVSPDKKNPVVTVCEGKGTQHNTTGPPRLVTLLGGNTGSTNQSGNSEGLVPTVIS